MNGMNEETNGIIKDEGVGGVGHVGAVVAVVADDKGNKSGKVGKGVKVKALAPAKATPIKGKGEKKGKPVVVKATKPVKSVPTVKSAKSVPAKAMPKPAKPIKEGKKAEKTNGKIYPRHQNNPFRLNSSYGKVFDAFASFKNGVRRDELLTKVAEAVGKDLKHAAYDLAVILSAKDSNTGSRHRSCREGYWCRRENDHLTLMID